MNIIVAIGGGVAAYKVLWLIRLLKKANHQVKVILTQSATQFITPTSVAALSANRPYHDNDLWQTPESHDDKKSQLGGDDIGYNMPHITLAKWADFIIIAPATANRISLLATGSCQDLLGNVVMASKASLAIVPAMNKQMWNNAATQDNITRLKKRNIIIWGPDCGIQACGDDGVGRLLEPEQIMAKFDDWMRPMELTFSRLLLTVGATQEPIDPVRYISNHSSGKMGIEIAKLAHQYGVSVTVVHACVNEQLFAELPEGMEKVAVQTACQMHDCVGQLIHSARKTQSPYEVFIGCAAVADYRSAEYSEQKIKKTTADSLTLTLVKNPDIIKQVGVNRKNNLPFCVGFALESEQLVHHAEQKLNNKKMDIIFANSIDSMNATQSAITALWQSHQPPYEVEIKRLPYREKVVNAESVLQLISQHYQANHPNQ